MLRWRQRRWRAAALQRKSGEGFDQHRNAEQDQNRAEPSNQLEIEERRLQTPSRHHHGATPATITGAIRKKSADPSTALALVMVCALRRRGKEAPDLTGCCR